jgi:c-di-GMP-related signal transduction protein
MPESVLNEFYLGRQAILDRSQNLFAFELLFRSSRANRADFADSWAATASVVTHAFGELGIGSALGKFRGFINVDADFLLSDTIELLPCKSIVLEILETVRFTPEVVGRCRELKQLGFELALDDVQQIQSDYQDVLGMIDVVKVDLKQVSPADLPKITKQLKPWRVKLLAKKIDSQDEARRYLELGYDYFQGYYYA